MAGPRRSLQELSAEVATNPNSTAFVELAAAYRERGDLARAMRLSLRGLERHPTHVEAHFELGCIYEAGGERELALDEWSIVRQLAPDHLAGIYALVRLYLEEGRLDDAERELASARSLAPNSPQIAALMERFDAAAADAPGVVSNDAPPVNATNGLEDSEAIGVLLVDAQGRLTAGQMQGGSAESNKELGKNLSDARAEAERVASYLELGEWKGMVVESSAARLSVTPVGESVVIVVTTPDMPAGGAVRVVRRARENARAFLEAETE